jgi:RHH-type proline utilization regulon transcriptional repressor/proline dehydrogenase/delta 1-pyrroline-5-carboxylate dehydrogenase
MYEIGSLSELNRENFGPILHVVRFAPRIWQGRRGDQRDRLRADARPQSRIDTVRDFRRAARASGNFYVNRNQIGAVVESQPVRR